MVKIRTIPSDPKVCTQMNWYYLMLNDTFNYQCMLTHVTYCFRSPSWKPL